MKVYYWIVTISALVAIAMAKVPASVKSSMKCGECILYGYNSCTKNKDHALVKTYSTSSSANQCYA